MSSIDLTPLLNGVIWPLVAALVPVLGAWLAYRLARLLKINEQNQNRPILDQAVQTATNLLLQELEAWRKQAGRTTIDISNATVAKYANYVVQQVPEVLKTVGVTPEQVKRKLLAEVMKSDQSNVVPSVSDEPVAQMKGPHDGNA